MADKANTPRLRSDLPDRMTLDWQGTRAFMRGMGRTDAEMELPHIGIVNTWNEMNPGHIHLREVAQAATEGVREGGGAPFNFNGFSLCDCVGGGPYVLPSRDFLVNEIELIAEAHKLDGLVLLGTCDKVVPAMLMAAGRLDIPTVIVTGGYMRTGKIGDQYVDFIDIGASISKVHDGKMTEKEFDDLLNQVSAYPSGGSCGMMGTANTMSLLTECIGMSIPGNATTPARSDSIFQVAREAGRQVVDLWRKGITPRQIITDQTITNAIRVCMAIGGSSNTIIHIPAVATETELTLDCSEVYAQASMEVPLLTGIRPNGPHAMKDFEEAGGLGALMNEIREFLQLDHITVTGKTQAENIAHCKNRNPQVIHTLKDPLEGEGGLVLVKGNLVPEGAFIKQSAVPEELMSFRGPAHVFTDCDEAIEALYNGGIKKGEAVLIIYQGVKAGPSSAYAFTTALKGSELRNDVITITDGRLSGAASGACFGYASPEAALRGPLCGVKDGDIIKYDIASRTLEVELSDAELQKRMEEAELILHPKKGYLGIYQRCVGSILKGAVLRGDEGSQKPAEALSGTR